MPGECCTDADCGHAPDWCHTVQGATCNQGVCSFPLKQCPAGSACVEPPSGTCGVSPLTLTVTPSAASYPDGPLLFSSGAVSFTATLTNVSDAPVTVSAFAPGNLRIVALSKDGKPLQPGAAPIDSLVDFDVLATQALTTLAPSASASFGQPTVASTAPTNLSPCTRLQFDDAGPGTYAAIFTYQYTGTSTTAYRGIVVSAPVSFVVQ
jgi:hypothetical protein